jgi:hypothetical protein
MQLLGALLVNRISTIIVDLKYLLLFQVDSPMTNGKSPLSSLSGPLIQHTQQCLSYSI